MTRLDVIRRFAIFGFLVADINWSLGWLPQQEWSSFDSNLELFFEFTVVPRRPCPRAGSFLA